MLDIQTAHAKLGSQDGNSREQDQGPKWLLSEIKDVANLRHLYSEPGSRYLIMNVVTTQQPMIVAPII